jgi:hypothetical protein
MNSWNRMPFLSEISSVPGASYYPQLSETLGVFGIGNYGASQSYDNDDGSSFDHTHDNYFALSDGFKVCDMVDASTQFKVKLTQSFSSSSFLLSSSTLDGLWWFKQHLS